MRLIKILSLFLFAALGASAQTIVTGTATVKGAATVPGNAPASAPTFTGINCSGGLSITCNVGTVTTGQVIVYGEGWFAGTGTLTVTDNCGVAGGSDTYTTIDSNVGGPLSAQTGIATVGAGRANCTLTLVATTGGAIKGAVAVVTGVTGVDGANHQINFQASGTTGANAVTSGTALNTTTADAVFGFTLNDTGGTVAAGTGFTLLAASGTTFGGESLVQSSAGSIQVTFTASGGPGNWRTGIVCLH